MGARVRRGLMDHGWWWGGLLDSWWSTWRRGAPTPSIIVGELRREERMEAGCCPVEFHHWFGWGFSRECDASRVDGPGRGRKIDHDALNLVLGCLIDKISK